MVLKAADKNLMDDDLVQMVNAGVIPAIAATKQRADLWSQVLDHIQPHPDLVIASGIQLAWVMRNNNPQFKQLVDEFVQSHAVRTSFGSTLLRRYLQNTKWVSNIGSVIAGDYTKPFACRPNSLQSTSGTISWRASRPSVARRTRAVVISFQPLSISWCALSLLPVEAYACLAPSVNTLSPASVVLNRYRRGFCHASVSIHETYVQNASVQPVCGHALANVRAGPRAARLRHQAGGLQCCYCDVVIF